MPHAQAMLLFLVQAALTQIGERKRRAEERQRREEEERKQCIICMVHPLRWIVDEHEFCRLVRRRTNEERPRFSSVLFHAQEQAKEMVFVPCGHNVACARCAERLERCPTCRASIQQAIRLFAA